jgi:hypothetical protein
MKYFTKEWQQRISDTPDSARTLASEASALYKAEQAKNPISEDFEKQLDFTTQELNVPSWTETICICILTIRG